MSRAVPNACFYGGSVPGVPFRNSSRSQRQKVGARMGALEETELGKVLPANKFVIEIESPLGTNARFQIVQSSPES
jgi:hypothetical protein